MGRQVRSGVPFGTAARRLTIRADREARALGQDYVGCEHLFLAMLADAEGRSVLEKAGLPVDLVREHLKDLAKSWSGPGDGVRSPTPRLERVLDLASQWAQATEVAEVGVEELLLAVLDSREASGVIEFALVKAGGTSSMLLSTAIKARS
jgi:ATP-dependent Clp protease ATP-binding subunit ClpA